MDNLRDKIRSRRADTSDLDAVHISAPTAALSDAFNQIDEMDEAPASEADFATSGNTDSLISEIFADEHHAVPVFGTHEKASKPKAESRKAEPEPKPKKPLDLPFLNQLKKLEVNRKMLLISLVVAGVATFLSMAYINSVSTAHGTMVKVISIKKDVPADTLLTQEMLDIREVPADYVPQGALVYKANLPVLGKKTVAALYKGEILNSNRIVDPAPGGLNVNIPDKHKAIEIRAKNASMLHGSTPDQKEYIDLIASIPDPSPLRQGKIITYTILQRVMVLKAGSGKDSNMSSASEAVTLAVPDDHVNLMIMLQEKSSFTAVPRSPTDESTKPVEYTVQEIEDAIQGRIESAKSASSAPASPASAAPVKADPPAPAVPQGHGPDLSGGGGGYTAPARSYSAPARSYSAPARSYSAPARSYSAPARTYTPPARVAPPPASRPITRMPRITIQGGAVTQSGN